MDGAVWLRSLGLEQYAAVCQNAWEPPLQPTGGGVGGLAEAGGLPVPTRKQSDDLIPDSVLFSKS
jgi:hypothetical protein